METFDVIIIGGGPGGVKAAKVLAGGVKKVALKVALVEQHLVGGECLHYGCIPSKVYLYGSELFEKAQRMAEFGVLADNVRFDFSKLVERRKRVVEMLHRGLRASLEKMGVVIFDGVGKMVDGDGDGRDASGDGGSAGQKIVEINGEKISARFIILAAGSEPMMLPGLTDNLNGDLNDNLNGAQILTNRTIFDLEKLPKSLLIVGGGATGCEFASFFGAVGVPVTLVERGERILSFADADLSAELAKLLARRNVKILTNTSFEEVLNENFEYILMAVGRKVSRDEKFAPINEFMQTNVANVYVIGDYAKRVLLAYTAEREGEVAARHILQNLQNDASTKSPDATMAMDYAAFPNVIFTHPEVATVGVTEAEAREKFGDVIVGRATFSANSKALIEGDRDGFVKVVASRDGDGRDGARSDVIIRGVHIIGKNASLLIDKAVLAVAETMTAAGFLRSLHAHPVLSEVLKEAVEDAIRQM